MTQWNKLFKPDGAAEGAAEGAAGGSAEGARGGANAAAPAPAPAELAAEPAAEPAAAPAPATSARSFASGSGYYSSYNIPSRSRYAMSDQTQRDLSREFCRQLGPIARDPYSWEPVRGCRDAGVPQSSSSFRSEYSKSRGISGFSQKRGFSSF